MEKWDLYDRNRNLLKKTTIRSDNEILPKGIYHLIVAAFTFSSGKLLLTTRSKEKVVCPGKLENTAGSAISGETSLKAIKRELFEETGILTDDFELIGTKIENDAIIDVYIVNKEIDMRSLVFQEGETTDAILVDKTEWERLLTEDDVCLNVKKRYHEFSDTLDNFFN